MIHKRLKKRLCDEKGLTLTELLATLVIVILGSSIVTMGIPSAARAYGSFVDASNAQVLLSTTTTLLRDKLAMASEWSVSADGNTITFTSETSVDEQTLTLVSGAEEFHKNELLLNGQPLAIDATSVGARRNKNLYVTCGGFEKVGHDTIQFNNIKVYKESGDPAVSDPESDDSELVHLSEFAVLMLVWTS